jgi:hypothetical protein
MTDHRITPAEVEAFEKLGGEPEPLVKYSVFVGPCTHKRDPWDRCDEEGGCVDLAEAVIGNRVLVSKALFAGVPRMLAELRRCWALLEPVPGKVEHRAFECACCETTTPHHRPKGSAQVSFACKVCGSLQRAEPQLQPNRADDDFAEWYRDCDWVLPDQTPRRMTVSVCNDDLIDLHECEMTSRSETAQRLAGGQRGGMTLTGAEAEWLLQALRAAIEFRRESSARTAAELAQPVAAEGSSGE